MIRDVRRRSKAGAGVERDRKVPALARPLSLKRGKKEKKERGSIYTQRRWQGKRGRYRCRLSRKRDGERYNKDLGGRKIGPSLSTIGSKGNGRMLRMGKPTARWVIRSEEKR